MKTINMRLSQSSISNAIREVEQYRKEVEEKSSLIGQKIGEAMKDIAQSNFNSAISEVFYGGSTQQASVSVTAESNENVTLVIANGKDAVFVEFGAGVYTNTPVGSSPHPKGAELGMTIGGYGKGQGARHIWGYYNEMGELVLTRGAPCQMPLFRAALEIVSRIPDIARGVFA